MEPTILEEFDLSMFPSWCLDPVFLLSPSMVRCFGTRNPKVALNQDSGFARFRDYTSIILGLETTSSRILPAHYTSIEFRFFPLLHHNDAKHNDAKKCLAAFDQLHLAGQFAGAFGCQYLGCALVTSRNGFSSRGSLEEQTTWSAPYDDNIKNPETYQDVFCRCLLFDAPSESKCKSRKKTPIWLIDHDWSSFSRFLNLPDFRWPTNPNIFCAGPLFCKPTPSNITYIQIPSIWDKHPEQIHY